MSASHRGRMDIAMIGLMRDGLLRVKEASDLRWSAIYLMDDGTGRLHLGEGEGAVARTLSADTMMMLDSVRGNARDDERISRIDAQPGKCPHRSCCRAGRTRSGIQRRESTSRHAEGPRRAGRCAAG